MPVWRAHLPNLRSVEVVATGEGWRVTEWTAAYLGAEVSWRQRDEIDPDRLALRSRLTSGTVLRRLDIDGQLRPVEGRTEVRLSIAVEVGRFPGLILPAVREVIRRNGAALLAGLAGAAAATHRT